MCVVTDAWPGWFTLPLGDRLSLCNAHARRPFADWLKRHPRHPDAHRIIAIYRNLGRSEHEADDGPPTDLLDLRRRIRAEHFCGIMAQLKAEAERITTAYPASHQLATARATSSTTGKASPGSSSAQNYRWILIQPRSPCASMP